MPALPHSIEAERLAALHALGLVPDGDGATMEPQPALDALADCAARLVGTPVAMITLVDADTQWVVARTGVDLQRTPRAHAFCAQAILGHGLMEVSDLRADARFEDNPFVTGAPHVRFYAGQPLLIDGQAVGTLCVLDRQVRSLTPRDRETLAQLGRAAVELLQSRQRLRDADAQRERLLDFGRAAGDWMWETDAEHRYTWLSATVEILTGIDPESLVGLTVSDADLLDEQGRPLVEGGTLHQLLDRHAPFARAIVCKHTPHGTLYLSRSAVPVLDADGRFAGYRGTVRDITAALATAERARSSDATLRQLADQAPGVLFSFELPAEGPGRYRFISNGAHQVFGSPVAELMADSQAFFRRVHPDDREALGNAIDRCGDTLTRLAHTFRIVHPDGSTRWMETHAAPTRLPDGGTLWHGFSADITDRVATEDVLRAHEERWQMAAAAAGLGIASLNLADGKVTLDQRACINHGLQFPQPDFLLTDWAAQIDPADRAAATTGVQQAIVGAAAFEGRYRIHRPDGVMRWLEFVVRGIHENGEPIGAIGICRDVHEQQVAADLRRTAADAERASRAKSEFLSRVSHELRTPLNGILGFAQLMALDREHPLAGTQARRLGSVQRAGRHLLDLINDVLELTRIERDGFELAQEPVDLDAALRASLALVQPLADDRRIAIAAPPRSGAWALGDARAIEQVLMNLLSNAVKYSPADGAVQVALARDGARLAIAVRDEGEGLTEAQRARLFQPFDRLGAERHKIEGSGLGLVIARQLAETMGGRIEVMSAPGAGSTFTLWLPASERDGDAVDTGPGQLHVPGAPTIRVTPPRRVVYIEDEALNQVLLQEVFRARPSWRLEIAGDGAHGMAVARAQTPDLMLIDMNLPDTTGLALIRRLRADPATQALRCIALSADAMVEQIDAARAAGFDDYWTKPIDVSKVLTALDELLA